MGKLTKPIELKEGKHYYIKTPNSAYFKSKKVHIDKVMDNPCYSPQEDCIDNSEDMIIYRIWSRRGWKFFISPYWELCLWNDWNFKK